MGWIQVSKIDHKDTGIKTPEGYSFARNTPFIPLLPFELSKCVTFMPIIFLQMTNGKKVVGLTSLKKDNNVFVASNGSWRAPYIPARLRIYPFQFASLDQNVRTLVVYDDGKMLVDKTNGRALFNDDGTESDFLQNALKLLKDIDAGEKQNQKILELFNELNLFNSEPITINLDGKKIRLEGAFSIDEEAFLGLTGKNLKKLQNSFGMHLIFAHFYSLGNLKDIISLQNVFEESAKKLQKLGASIFHEDNSFNWAND